ncbi:sensor histidine kinase N-terminal domain-containing protein [Pseudoduganella sp. UC29_106]|uniref:sensor histidine kinase N-terminal domain-containing protein n=1 Tax=Pseudoduganella sp. UC29_106 TaxID=3374553 RepID=UPI0037573930
MASWPSAWAAPRATSCAPTMWTASTTRSSAPRAITWTATATCRSRKPRPIRDSFRAGAVDFRNENLHGAPIRIAYSYVNLEQDKSKDPRLALVQVAETLEKRASWPMKSSRA